MLAQMATKSNLNFAHSCCPCRANTAKGIKNGIAALKTAAIPFAHKSTSYKTAVFYSSPGSRGQELYRSICVTLGPVFTTAGHRLDGSLAAVHR